jgi:hypothetical protein
MYLNTHECYVFVRKYIAIHRLDYLHWAYALSCLPPSYATFLTATFALLVDRYALPLLSTCFIICVLRLNLLSAKCVGHALTMP